MTVINAETLAASSARRAAAAAIGVLLLTLTWASPGTAQASGPRELPLNAVPSIQDLPEAPFATLGMKLEKTFLKVDVLALTLRLDEASATRIAEIVGDQDHDRDLEAPIAAVGIAPTRAVAEIQFLRGISLDQFLGGVDDDMEKAVEAGWLEPETRAMLSDSLPVWFDFLETRRIEDGDRLHYEIRGDTLRTVFQGTREAAVLLDQTDVGRQNVLALLGAYFAPGSSFRRNLVRSLWRGWDPNDP